jgi:prophage regulatory protein
MRKLDDSQRAQGQVAQQSEKEGLERRTVTKSLQQILRRAEVERATGLPRATIYDKIAKGTFPPPIKLGERSVGWVETEILAWQKARIAERDAAAAHRKQKAL